MDLAGGLRRLGALRYRPGAHLVAAAGQEADEPQQGVGALDEPVKAALVQAQLLEEHRLVLLVQLAYLLLSPRADGQNLGVLGVGYGLDRLVVGVGLEVRHAVLVHIGGVNDRLETEQVNGLYKLALVLVALPAARGLAVVEVRKQALEDLGLVQGLFVPALRGLFGLVYAALHQLHVRHYQLEVDYVYVARRIGAALDVDYVLVVKAAHHVDDGVGAADVLQELVAQTLAVAGALDQAGYVDELYHRRGVLLGVVHIAQEVQPLIRHGDDAHVRLNGAERVVRALRAGICYRVEQCALADVRQTDDS